MWWPTYLPVLFFIADELGPPWDWVSVAFVLVLAIGSIVYAATTAILLGKGDRRGRTGVAIGLAVVLVLSATAMAAAAAEGDLAWWVLPTVLPSVILQTIAWACTRSASAEQWFREHDSDRVAPEP